MLAYNRSSSAVVSHFAIIENVILQFQDSLAKTLNNRLTFSFGEIAAQATPTSPALKSVVRSRSVSRVCDHFTFNNLRFISLKDSFIYFFICLYRHLLLM